MALEVYSLLYISDEAPLQKVNVRYSSPENQFESLLGQAIQLHRTLQRFHGIGLRLVTNQAPRVAERLQSEPSANRPDLRECAFRDRGGPQAQFVESLHRLDVLHLLAEPPARSKSPYRLLLDLDVSCRHAPSPALQRLCADGTPSLYEITDQVVPAWGIDAVANDMETVLGKGRLATHQIRWFGGEFIGGLPNFFGQLSNRIEQLWPRYREGCNSLLAQGDESLYSAAMADPPNFGQVADAGRLGIVSRHWTIRTKHAPAPLARVLQSDFLHLPSSKALLAANARRRDPRVRPGQLLSKELVLSAKTFGRAVV
jgi:hypothetical protein